MAVQPDLSFTRAPLSDLSPALMQELGDNIAHKHPLEGAWTRDETGCPIIAVSIDRIADSLVGSRVLATLRRGGLQGFRIVGSLSTYQTSFGHMGTLSVALAHDQERTILPIARFCASIPPLFALVESPGCPEILLFRHQRP